MIKQFFVFFFVMAVFFLTGCSGKTAVPADMQQESLPETTPAPTETVISAESHSDSADPFDDHDFENDPFGDDDFDDDPFGDDDFEDDPFGDDSGSDYEDEVAVNDPFYGFNNAMFQVNDKFVYVLLKPVALGYRAMVPEPARKGIRNVFDNLLTPVRMVNCILQGKIDSAGTEFVRFFINTTVGIGGLMDVAKNHNGIYMADEDLGQTLGSYGIGNGFYLVLPLLGPTTARDFAGLLGDSYMSPLTHLDPIIYSYLSRGFDTQNRYSFTFELYEDIKESSIVPYEAFKDIYIQHRNKLVNE